MVCRPLPKRLNTRQTCCVLSLLVHVHDCLRALSEHIGFVKQSIKPKKTICKKSKQEKLDNREKLFSVLHLLTKFRDDPICRVHMTRNDSERNSFCG